MAQADYSIANQGFPATRADINSHLSAIATNNSGTSAPSTQYAGQFWIDTTSSTWTLYIHDGADDIQFATIDTSANTVNFIDSELGDNSVTTAKIADGNVTSAKLSYPLTTFSSTGIDDNATSTAITIDSSENVGIGTSSPSAKLHVDVSDSGVTPSVNADDLFVESSGSTGITIGSGTANFGRINFGDSEDANIGIIQYEHTTDAFAFTTNATQRMRIDSSGRVGIGESSPISELHITDSSGTAVMRLESSDSGDCRLNFDDQSATDRGRIIYAHSDDSLRTEVNGSERMRIESNGLVRIKNTSHTNSLITNNFNLVIGNESSGAHGLAILSPTNENGYISFFDSGNSGSFRGTLNYNHSDDSLRTYVNASERMRIDASGNVLVGKTESSTNVAGAELNEYGRVVGVRDAGTCATFSRLTNDGVIVDLRQANIQEGTISVSGTTVSYNGFTGTHWSRFQDNSTPTILKGTVLESLDEMCDWYNLEFDVVTQDEDGNDITTTEKIPHVLTDTQSNGDVITYNHEGTDYQATIVKETDIKHMMSKVSDTVDAKNVYGVFSAYDQDGEGYNDFYVASVGSFVVRIKANETIAKGDLLQSNGDGTAKVQTDDAVRSSSFAKVLSTTIIETYDDGSFIVPCSLMC